MNFLENKFLNFLLLPLSWAYSAIVRLRNLGYDRELFKTHTISNVRIISIGNISVGGTGKTPFTIYLAKLLARSGRKVAVLSRGYRRQSKGSLIVSDGNKIFADAEIAGDEPLLMAQNLPGIPVVCEADRVKGVKLIKENFNSQIVLLDDGFQHRRLHRDLDIVLFDASRFHSSQRVLPAGMLREPLTELRRANLLILTRINNVDNAEELRRTLSKYYQGNILAGLHKPTAFVRAQDLKEFELSSLQGKKVLIFSGIANPAAFEDTVRSLGLIPVKSFNYSDHHKFNKSDLEKISDIAGKLKVEALVTTEKDFVRLTGFKDLLPGNLYFLKIEFEITDDSQLFLDLLGEKILN